MWSNYILSQKRPLITEGVVKRLLFDSPGFAFFFRLYGGLDAGRGNGALFELVNASGRVQKLLLAGVKGMALAADFGMQSGCRGAGGKTGAAGATDNNGGIKLGVDGGFHGII